MGNKLGSYDRSRVIGGDRMPPPGNETDGRLHIHKDTEAFDALGAALRGNGKLEVGGKERTIYRAIVLENHVGPDGQPLEARDVEFMPPT